VIRHPIYTAALLWGAGWPLILASFWGLVAAWAFLMPSVLSRMKDEEARLLERFGVAYADYQSRSWRLIPFLY
jgi:protein-S-isoprenylcysteine O-methyltransferase Ste14